MKGKIIYILFFILAAGNLSAQVLIGNGKTNVNDGAVLELASSGKIDGVLLPRVALTDATVWQPVDGNPQNGMVVYNTNNTAANHLRGAGAYVWIDGRWQPVNPVMNPCTVAPAQPGAISFTAVKIGLYQSLVAYVAPVTGATSYEWILPQGLIGSSNTNFITIIGWQDATYNAGSITVKAVNDCGKSNEMLSSNDLVVEIPNKPPTEPVDNSGNGSLQGPTCFDVAMTEGGSTCGALSSRQQAFPAGNPAKRTRTYKLSLMANAGIRNLRVGLYDDADGIVKSIAGNKSGALSDMETITVVFADDVNTIVTNSRKSTVKIYAIYSDNGTDKRVELKITVQDCACCPLNAAKIIQNTVYQGKNALTLASGYMAQLVPAYFTRIPDAALCLYNTNNAQGYWSAADTDCKNLNITLGEEGWRLPNIAEVVDMLDKKILPISGGVTRYWSSSGFLDSTGGILGDRVYYGLGSSTATDQLFREGYKAATSNVDSRCVKTISY